jgi:hypothetical protein
LDERLRKLDACLSVIEPDRLGRDDAERYAEWIRVGIICSNESDGDERGLELWDNWSKRGRRYEQGVCEDKWGSFATDRQSKISIGTLVMLARDATGDQAWNIPRKPIFIPIHDPVDFFKGWGVL